MTDPTEAQRPNASAPAWAASGSGPSAASERIQASGTLVQAAVNPRLCPACGARYPADFRVCPRDATPLEDAPDDADPLVGQLLAGSYEVLRVIGEGGMGKVYEARHTRLNNKRFAVKLLHHELARQPEVVMRFQREAEAASALLHPNVVGVYDVNTSPDGRPYIVAELLEGEDLGRFLDRIGKLKPSEAVRIVRQVCRALGAAHEQGIVHRDVKPENVFLAGPDATVKVLDFGISKIAEGTANLTKTGTVMGTPDYMAPEQARGDRVDARADIYAVGAILYRALTGRKPFEGLDPMATLTAVLTQEPPRPTTIEPRIPLALELIVQHTMAKDPKHRYASMQALEDALGAFDPSVSGEQARLPTPVEIAVAPGMIEAARRTLAAATSAASTTDALADTARSVELARPGLVFFTGLGFLWVGVNLVVAVASLLRLIRGGDLYGVEVVLVVLGVLAAIVTPTALWVRHLASEVWPSTPRAIAMVARMRRAVLYGASAYGLSAVLVQLFESVVERRGAGIARPGWSLFLFLVAAAVSAVSWIASRPRPAE